MCRMGGKTKSIDSLTHSTFVLPRLKRCVLYFPLDAYWNRRCWDRLGLGLWLNLNRAGERDNIDLKPGWSNQTQTASYRLWHNVTWGTHRPRGRHPFLLIYQLGSPGNRFHGSSSITFVCLHAFPRYLGPRGPPASHPPKQGNIPYFERKT